MRSVKSAERTLALFELFSRRQRPLTVGRIADELSIPQPSASMLLANLREMGYFTYDAAARTYAPTIRVALLGSWINRQFDSAGSLTATLADLQKEIGETVFIGIQNGAFAQYVSAIHHHDPRAMRAESGQHRLLTGSAVGRVLLSLKPDAEILRWLHRCNAEAPEERLQIPASAFMGIIEEIRGQGFAQTSGDMTPTFGGIAVAVPAPAGLMPMAIGAGVPLERMDLKRDDIATALRRVSRVLAELAVPEPTAAEGASDDDAAAPMAGEA
jgi:DNA-binding IclR family transcriptional regulator